MSHHLNEHYICTCSDLTSYKKSNRKTRQCCKRNGFGGLRIHLWEPEQMWQEAPLVSLAHVFSLCTYVPEFFFSAHMCHNGKGGNRRTVLGHNGRATTNRRESDRSWCLLMLCGSNSSPPLSSPHARTMSEGIQRIASDSTSSSSAASW